MPKIIYHYILSQDSEGNYKYKFEPVTILAETDNGYRLAGNRTYVSYSKIDTVVNKNTFSLFSFNDNLKSYFLSEALRMKSEMLQVERSRLDRLQRSYDSIKNLIKEVK